MSSETLEVGQLEKVLYESLPEFLTRGGELISGRCLGDNFWECCALNAYLYIKHPERESTGNAVTLINLVLESLGASINQENQGLLGSFLIGFDDLNYPIMTEKETQFAALGQKIREKFQPKFQ